VENGTRSKWPIWHWLERAVRADGRLQGNMDESKQSSDR
jgi:hypothetical protein